MRLATERLNGRAPAFLAIGLMALTLSAAAVAEASVRNGQQAMVGGTQEGDWPSGNGTAVDGADEHTIPGGINESWDGLVRVKSKRLGLSYLRPHADFRGYSRVMFDPPEVAFAKNWQRDHNRGTVGRVSDRAMMKASNEAKASLARLFPARFAEAGFAQAQQPAPDVVRLSFAIADLSVRAPDTGRGAIARSYALDAGEATLVIEARDSITGQLLGRGVDRRIAGQGAGYRRTSMSNMADFERLFDEWARTAARGLNGLKAASPVDTDGIRQR